MSLEKKEEMNQVCLLDEAKSDALEQYVKCKKGSCSEGLSRKELSLKTIPEKRRSPKGSDMAEIHRRERNIQEGRQAQAEDGK